MFQLYRLEHAWSVKRHGGISLTLKLTRNLLQRPQPPKKSLPADTTKRLQIILSVEITKLMLMRRLL